MLCDFPSYCHLGSSPIFPRPLVSISRNRLPRNEHFCHHLLTLNNRYSCCFRVSSFPYYAMDGDLKPSLSDSICSMRSHNSTLFTRVMFVDDLYKLAPIFGLQSACNFVSILYVNKENLVFSHH